MITIRHLIGSKLHLDKRGMRILFNILVESVSNVLQWKSVLHSFTNGSCDTRKADELKSSNDSGLVQNVLFEGVS